MLAPTPRRSLSSSIPHAVPLLLGVLVAVALWQRLTLAFNGPYLDESDYLYVGKLLRAGLPWKTYTYVFSSHLPIQILGLGESCGGLYGARALAAVLGLGSLAFCYGAARALLGSRRVAGWTVLLLLLAAPHVFISKFATYDVVAFLFYAASLWLLAEGLRRQRRAWLWCLAASTVFAIAVLSKYVVVVHAPVLALIVAVRRPRLLAAAMLPCAAILFEYAHRHWADLRILYETQILQAHAKNSTRLQILWIAAAYAGPTALMAIAATAWLVRRGGAAWRLLRLPLLLAVLALPLVATHVRSADMVSMYKHMVYPIAALTPLAALLLHRLSRRSLLLPLSLVAAVAALGFYQTSRMEHAFPDLRPALARLVPEMTPSTSVITEEAYALRYAFAGSTVSSKIFEMTWFDNDGDNQHTPKDVVDAVWDGKPDLVLVYGQVMPILSAKLREGVLPHQYRKIYDQPYVISDVMSRATRGSIQVWKRNGAYTGKYPL
jgi:hypothetical protein